MRPPWIDDEDAIAGPRGRTAVLERPVELPAGLGPLPQPLGPRSEHNAQTVIAFPGMQPLAEEIEGFLMDVLSDFLEDAPRYGYRSLVLACDEDAPFRSILEQAADFATDTGDFAEVRFTAQPRRVDLAVILDWAALPYPGGMEALAHRLVGQRATAALIVGPETERGELAFWSLASLMDDDQGQVLQEQVGDPPAPQEELRVVERMFEVLGRAAHA